MLRLVIYSIDILNSWTTDARELFGTCLKNGPESLKECCLSRLKALLREPQPGKEFKSWAIPLLVNQISKNSYFTRMIVDILYENSEDSYSLDCIIKSLRNDQISYVTRIEETRYFIYRLISLNEGLSLLETQGDYVRDFILSFTVSRREMDGEL